MPYKIILLIFILIYANCSVPLYAQNKSNTKRYYLSKEKLSRHSSLLDTLSYLIKTNSTFNAGVHLYGWSEEKVIHNSIESFSLGFDYRIVQVGMQVFIGRFQLEHFDKELPIKYLSTTTYLALRFGKPDKPNQTSYYLLAGPASVYSQIEPKSLSSISGNNIGLFLGAGIVTYWDRLGIGLQFHWIDSKTKLANTKASYYNGTRDLQLIFKWLL